MTLANLAKSEKISFSQFNFTLAKSDDRSAAQHNVISGGFQYFYSLNYMNC